ncbi:hypothetical protein N7536_012024 [Penicillium majusculum]|uniref:Uncharacterized protein n=1 Tax=Penicillium solitum TaxID=60172 RepID=A0A1V6R6F3_9EURO|nr:uncharacterized protein PENSOL_c014G00225 [Penicillium solitum]KAJ5680885.1 hypothetical protein N7536_012024 [Penicillium majusculum]OQD96891.1 hypothetical protein PENSOL_c014G00225 [Penicillium solitum]
MAPMARNLLFRRQTLTFSVRNLQFSTRQSAIPLTGTNRPSLKRRDVKQEYQIQRMTSDHSASLHEKAIAALARLRSGTRPPRNPSKRTPERESSHNVADRLEKALNEAGFQSWGFSIYRCTYQSDSDWAEFLRRYRWHVADSLEHYNGLDLLESFEMTVFENQALFGGVGVSTGMATIREHFQQWATNAIQEEQGVSPDMLVFANVEAARYRFRLFVDEESLQSVLQTRLEDCFNKNAFVNMLNGWWKEDTIDDHDPEYLEDDELESVREELNGYDPIEAYTVNDVGWMKVAFCAAGLEGFSQMGEHGGWDRYYVRPSEICNYIQ